MDMRVHHRTNQGTVHYQGFTDHPRHLTQPEIVHEERYLRHKEILSSIQIELRTEIYASISLHFKFTNYRALQFNEIRRILAVHRKLYENTKTVLRFEIQITLTILKTTYNYAGQSCKVTFRRYFVCHDFLHDS